MQVKKAKETQVRIIAFTIRYTVFDMHLIWCEHHKHCQRIQLVKEINTVSWTRIKIYLPVISAGRICRYGKFYYVVSYFNLNNTGKYLHTQLCLTMRIINIRTRSPNTSINTRRHIYILLRPNPSLKCLHFWCKIPAFPTHQNIGQPGIAIKSI